MKLGDILNLGKKPGYSITDFGDRMVACFYGEESARKLGFLFGYQWLWTSTTTCWCYKENYSFCAFAGFSHFDHK